MYVHRVTKPSCYQWKTQCTFYYHSCDPHRDMDAYYDCIFYFILLLRFSFRAWGKSLPLIWQWDGSVVFFRCRKSEKINYKNIKIASLLQLHVLFCLKSHSKFRPSFFLSTRQVSRWYVWRRTFCRYVFFLFFLQFKPTRKMFVFYFPNETSDQSFSR